MSETVLIERRDEIAVVTLNRPERLNALDLSMWRRLGEAMAEVNAVPELRCVLVRGAGGRAFAAGADIAEFERERHSAAAAERYAEVMRPAFEAIVHSPHPTIAMIEGACIGGGLEIALECDLRLANRSARFGIPINRLGHILAYEGLVPLVALVGRAVALELLLEGRILDAEEAYVKGLVNRVLPDESLEAEAFATAKRIAAGAPLAARGHRDFTRRLLDPRPLTAEELKAPYAVCDSADYREGIRAFLAKERPRFSGR